MSINWEAWEYLVGEWEGGHGGSPGQGYGIFSFSYELDRNILVRKNRTSFPGTAERAGFTHDDLLIIYTEPTGQKRGVYFDNEEHTIHYEVKVSHDQNTIVLESDPMPSIPQFRFTYIKTGENSLVARFEMTPPGKPGEYFTYLEGEAHKKV